MAACHPHAEEVADARLRNGIRSRTALDPDYWSFQHRRRGRGEHELFQYPAMMVSPMQGALLDVLMEQRPGQPVVYDPFVGSGTTLSEAMRRGLPFLGTDINPLAILLCRVKTAEAAGAGALNAVQRIAIRAHARMSRREPLQLRDELKRWYRPDVARGLHALAQGIAAERNRAVRRLGWATLAEVARTSGRFRISTPKLQMRPEPELGRPLDVVGRFVEIGRANVEEVERTAARLSEAGWGYGRLYGPGVWLDRCDVLTGRLRAEAPQADIVLTSPPYGDNHTTIPYGQQSFLPLAWLDLDDIEAEVDPSLLERIRSLDTRSLGGSRRITPDRMAAVSERSHTLRKLLGQLPDTGWVPGRQRVASFFLDIDAAFAQVLLRCRPRAHLVLTLGDRTVAGKRVHTSDILTELLEARGAVQVDRFDRPIGHGKRLARRNQRGATIESETVLILRRSAR